MTQDGAVCWLHLGDQHLDPRQERHFGDLWALVAQARAHLSEVDFVYLPGDVAEHAEPREYALARDALSGVRSALFAVPGDHDFAQGDLAAFRATFPDAPPFVREVGGRRCLFLDMVSAGSGGPDFRLGAAQIEWLKRELAAADGGALVFMHAYPADLADPAERRAVVDLFGAHRVLSIDMGHTHYNELANDGRTIYAATRSIGQIEEGPPGFSLMAVDVDGAVSWRFKPLKHGWPLVLISSPADRRLTTPFGPRVRPGEPFAVRALAFPPKGVVECRFRLDEGEWRPMERVSIRLWRAWAQAPDAPFRLAVEARLAEGASERDEIEVTPGHQALPVPPERTGSDAHAVGAWPERHIPGSQLGPNRNGRKW